MLENGTNPTAVAADHAAQYGVNVGFVYRNALKGYSAVIPAASLDALSADARVAYVERDSPSTSTPRRPAPPGASTAIDQRALPLAGTYTYTATGAGVTAYVIDTGIRTTHTRFRRPRRARLRRDRRRRRTPTTATATARTSPARSAARPTASPRACTRRRPRARLRRQRRQLRRHRRRRLGHRQPQAGQPAVANMSLGGGTSAALDDGGRATRSPTASPTASPRATRPTTRAPSRRPRVPRRSPSARRPAPTRARRSRNFGTVRRLVRAGLDITSASYLTDTGTATMSGTSMATPHVAGAAALYLQGIAGRDAAAGSRRALRPDDEEHRHGRTEHERPPALLEPLAAALGSRLRPAPELTRTMLPTAGRSAAW